MPTEIKIVLPDTGIDDNLSTTTDADNYDRNSNIVPNGGSVKSFHNDNIHVTNQVNAISHTQHTQDISPKPLSLNARGNNTANHLTTTTDSNWISFNTLNSQLSTLKNYRQNADHCNSNQDNYNDPEGKDLSSKPSRVAVHRTQHHLLDGDLVAGQGPSLVVLEDKTFHHGATRKTSPAAGGISRKVRRPKTADASTIRRSKDFRPSITETYDVDLEHRDIMMKALQSYSEYQSNGAETKRSLSRSDGSAPLWDDKLNRLAQQLGDGDTPWNVQQDPDGSTPGLSYSTNVDRSAPAFKLSQCRLRYYDDGNNADNGNTTRRRKRSGSASKKKKAQTNIKINENHRQRPSSARSAPAPVLYPREERNGVLVDSVGHIYRASEPSRPRSALPCKRTDFVKLSGQEFSCDRQNKTPDSQTAHSSPTKAVQVKRPQSGSALRLRRFASNNTNSNSGDPQSALTTVSSHSRSRSIGSRSLNVVTLRLDGANVFPGGAMAGQPIPHSVAYQRRNRTTHAWGDSSCLSQSLPNSSFLHRNYGGRSLGGSTASSPRSIRGDNGPFSERSSPAGKPSDPKPSASYSYDGGFFVGAHANPAEYFVIHPDWVSEVMTIKKLSVSTAATGRKTKAAPPLSHSATFRPRSLQGRRCLSAPPQKRRNPITWDPGFLADASNFDGCDDTKSIGLVNGDVSK